MIFTPFHKSMFLNICEEECAGLFVKKDGQDYLLRRKHICDSARACCSTRRVGGSVGFSFNPYQTRPLRKFISRPFKGPLSYF